MDKSAKSKSDIENIVDDIDHHLKQVDKKLDKIRLLLHPMEEASGAGSEQAARAVELKEEASEVDRGEVDRLVREFKQGRRMEVVDPVGDPDCGSCPFCGSPLSVLNRAPLVVECSNEKCSNRFSSKQ